MSVSDDFNYKMPTQYKPEFRSRLTYELLYETINNERNGIENNFDAKEVFNRRDSSSIINKLKQQLHLDVKAYAAKSDEEKFNVLKLLYFIINTNKYNEYNDDILKSVSVINLMAKPSLEHTDSTNARYEEHFRKIIEEIRPGVNNPDYREEAIKKIHALWKQHHININCTVLEDIQLRSSNLKEINFRLKSILDSLDRNKILELQKTNEGIIDTFYNMLISSRIIAETEDELKVIYDYQGEETVTKTITDISMNSLFSKTTRWEEFKAIITTDNPDLTDNVTRLIWSLLLYKENITISDIHSIDKSSYNFAKKYAKTVAEYWVQKSYNRDYITLVEWITVMQELMCVHGNKTEYLNCFIRHINPKVKLTAAIKKFDQASELPHMIILNRLTNRMILNFGTRELFEEKIRADKYIMKIEQIIFSYKNIEDIQTAHNNLFFRVVSALITDSECDDIPYTINNEINNRLAENNIHRIHLVPDKNGFLYFLIHILAGDRTYRLTQNKNFMELRQKWSNNTENLSDILEEYRKLSFSTNAIDIIIEQFAEEIKYIYNKFYPFKMNNYISSIFTIPVYYGEYNEYYCYIQFRFYSDSNAIEISYVSFIGKNIESFDCYKQLLLY